MRNLKATLQFIYCLYAVVTFLILMVPVFIWSAAVINFGRVRGGSLIYEGCKVWADVWLFLLGIRHRNIYLAPVDPKRSYIFVVNHTSYLDAVLVPKAIRQSTRALGKVEMSKIPVFGFIYKYAIVTVDRSSAENRSKSVYLLKSILKKGISVLVFPEGTFNMTHQPLKEFYDGAFRVAIETKTPIKPVIFLDAYSRLHYSSIFTLNPGISRAVFLPEISVDGLTSGDVAFLKQKVYSEMENALNSYRAKWIQVETSATVS